MHIETAGLSCNVDSTAADQGYRPSNEMSKCPATVDASQPTHPIAIMETKGITGRPDAPKRSHGTFEVKFLIDERTSLEIMDWARHHLDADPHCDPSLGESYRVNSLYLDTPVFDVFHRSPGFRQQKFRLRRYGSESMVWFEEKHKRKGLVRKRRVSALDSEISSRMTLLPQEDWNGDWFRRRIDNRRLRPVCQVTYQRFARLKTTDDGPVRLTIDDCLVARLAEGWNVPAGPIDGLPLLEGQRILELKFRDSMPGLFRQLIEEQKLQVTSFSKYRTSVETCVPLDSIAGDDVQGLVNA